MRNVIALRILRKHLKGGRVPIFLKNPFACSTPTFHRVTGHDRGTISLSRDDSNCPAKSFHKIFFLPSSCLDADSTKVEILFSRRDHACCRNGAIIIEFSTRCELPRRNLGCSAGHARISEYPCCSSPGWQFTSRATRSLVSFPPTRRLFTILLYVASSYTYFAILAYISSSIIKYGKWK